MRYRKNERMETLEEKIARVVKEEVAVVAYDPRWPVMFEQERLHLLSCLPAGLIRLKKESAPRGRPLIEFRRRMAQSSSPPGFAGGT